MYKLTVIAGPNRGTSYALTDRELSIGRQNGNGVVLPSSKVSKRHCVLVVNNDRVLLRDEGSANGTFVNGSLTQEKQVRPGDRISVGDYVFELRKASKKSKAQLPAVSGMGNVLQFPTPYAPRAQQLGGPSEPFIQPQMPSAPVIPKDLKGRFLYYFDHYVMPLFYGMNFKNEWRMLGAGVIATFLVANLLLSIYPLLTANNASIIKESQRRAHYMAKQIAERNVTALANGAETQTEIGSMQTEDGVRMAILIDLENRIIAPSSKMNQYLTVGGEAVIANKARNLFRQGRETGVTGVADSSSVVAIEPVKVFNAKLAQNVVIAMAVVSIDTSLATPDAGEIGMIYSQALILTGLLAAFVFLILYKLTLKPFQVLNDDIDKVLKGDMSQVTHEFKIEELNALWDIINSALQRVPKSEVRGDAAQDPNSVAIDDALAPVKMAAEAAKQGLLICDSHRNVLYLNSMFEEISGIRLESASGQNVTAIARDQAFGTLASDLFDRAPSHLDGIHEDFDFSGILYRVHVAALGSQSPKGYILLVVKSDG